MKCFIESTQLFMNLHARAHTHTHTLAEEHALR